MEAIAQIRTEEVVKPKEHPGMMRCPDCASMALYKYGKVKNRQRFICLLCGRQFIDGHTRFMLKKRPLCPVCGKPMYIYKQYDSTIRFRCSSYPKCRTFLKSERGETEE